jgi:uncharacterized small protein (DUF1192 family)
MASDTLRQVGELQQGGVWTSDDLLGDDSWGGEPATRPAESKDKQVNFKPRTPEQEDAEDLAKYVRDPAFVESIARAIEKKMLLNSGRQSKTSLIQQLTQEKDEAIERVKDWITTTQMTQSVKSQDDSSQALSRVEALEEKIISLEQKVSELMHTAVDQKSEEREMINEAYQIIKNQRNDEIGSDHTPSEVSRLDRRTAELTAQIQRLQTEAQRIPKPPAGPAKNNQRKFGSLF